MAEGIPVKHLDDLNNLPFQMLLDLAEEGGNKVAIENALTDSVTSHRESFAAAGFNPCTPNRVLTGVSSSVQCRPLFDLNLPPTTMNTDSTPLMTPQNNNKAKNLRESPSVKTPSPKAAKRKHRPKVIIEESKKYTHAVPQDPTGVKRKIHFSNDEETNTVQGKMNPGSQMRQKCPGGSIYNSACLTPERPVSGLQRQNEAETKMNCDESESNNQYEAGTLDDFILACLPIAASSSQQTVPTPNNHVRHDRDSLRGSFTSQIESENNHVASMGPPLAPALTYMPPVDSTGEQLSQQNAFQACHTHYHEEHALVPYQRSGVVVPFDGSSDHVKRKIPQSKVDLDDETNRVWKLLLENTNSEGIDGDTEERKKWWEEERRVLNEKTKLFILRMHSLQGDRRFSEWKGSVLDSLVGVFLTQNVTDVLSSSAFMLLAARFPPKLKTQLADSDTEEVFGFGLEETSRLNNNISNQSACGEDTEMNKDFEGDRIRKVSSDKTSKNEGSDKTGSVKLIKLFGTIVYEVNESSAKSGSGENRKIRSASSVNIRELSSEFSSGTTFQKTTDISFEGGPKSLSEQAMENNNDQSEIKQKGKVPAQEDSKSPIQETQQNMTDVVGGSSNKNPERGEANSSKKGPRRYRRRTVDGTKAMAETPKKKKEKQTDWDQLRKQTLIGGTERARTDNTMDSVDWDAVRRADVNEIAEIIKARGMNKKLAERINDLLNRILKDHGSIDLEWLRDVQPDKAKEYLLSIMGMGLKSVECVRLLTLHQIAFPVDVNVARIAVRLGWVPLQTLPDSLQIHLLELYPVLESVQKYLWPRLCKLDQRTLYELHYQMITFGKVFCTKAKPNCNACPMSGDCRHFASAAASSRLALPATEKEGYMSPTQNREAGQFQLPPPVASDVSNYEPIIEEPPSPQPIDEVKDIESVFSDDNDEIPTIHLNMDEFTHNLQNTELGEGDISMALVALTSDVSSIPMPKLKNVNGLRTEHQAYELPDLHPLLEGMDKREPNDPSPYLFAMMTPGETTDESGSSNNQTVKGTILIPCRTAMRGRFPLNGTYFQVNETTKVACPQLTFQESGYGTCQREQCILGHQCIAFLKGWPKKIFYAAFGEDLCVSEALRGKQEHPGLLSPGCIFPEGHGVHNVRALPGLASWFRNSIYGPRIRLRNFAFCTCRMRFRSHM